MVEGLLFFSECVSLNATSIGNVTDIVSGNETGKLVLEKKVWKLGTLPGVFYRNR